MKYKIKEPYKVKDNDQSTSFFSESRNEDFFFSMQLPLNEIVK